MSYTTNAEVSAEVSAAYFITSAQNYRKVSITVFNLNIHENAHYYKSQRNL